MARHIRVFTLTFLLLLLFSFFLFSGLGATIKARPDLIMGVAPAPAPAAAPVSVRASDSTSAPVFASPPAPPPVPGPAAPSAYPFSIPAAAQWAFAIFGAANALFSCVEKIGKSWSWRGRDWFHWFWNTPKVAMARVRILKLVQWWWEKVQPWWELVQPWWSVVEEFGRSLIQGEEGYVTPREGPNSPVEDHSHTQ
ncbi:hypothetical protein PENSTE_c026G02162 [Penicillium steckii]|uniref:Uncharacterized protein n=1 Tax=Penicillium steckii TaxID=303698 RepID=A0A1V6SQN5_9EURO|nr:hypothetical protein PENSTE_c026G02162 [Penicillium steckii]